MDIIIKMGKKYELDKEEKDLFRSAVRGVKPLKHTKLSLQKPTPKKVSIPSQKKQPNSNPFNLYNEENAEEVGGEQTLEFHRGGLQHKVLRKLRRGQYNVEATLDLHGMHVGTAREELSHFLLACLKNGVRHALIVHGKGHGKTKPILKNKLNQWLPQIEYVLAFCSATKQDGHTGAVYVLLKGSSQFDE